MVNGGESNVYHTHTSQLSETNNDVSMENMTDGARVRFLPLERGKRWGESQPIGCCRELYRQHTTRYQLIKVARVRGQGEEGNVREGERIKEEVIEGEPDAARPPCCSKRMSCEESTQSARRSISVDRSLTTPG